MSKIIRIRCPLCGFLGNQKRLDAEHEFEIVIQQTMSRGRGGITHRYYEPENESGVWLLKLALIEKIEYVLRKLKQDLREEKADAYVDALRSGEYAEARKVSSTYHADFGEMLASVESLTGAVCVLPAAPAPSQLKSEAPMVALIPALLGVPVQGVMKSRPGWSVPVDVKTKLGRSVRENVKSERYTDDGIQVPAPTVESDVALSFSGVGRSTSEGGGGSVSRVFAGGPVGGSVKSSSSGGIGGKGKSKKGVYDEEVTSASKLVD